MPNPDAAALLGYAKMNNATVNTMLKTGASLEACLFGVVKENEALLKRIMELEAIAPRKIKVGDQTFIYRCPDRLVPER